MLHGPRITLPAEVKLSTLDLSHSHHFISHFHKHDGVSAARLLQIRFMTENNHRRVFPTVAPSLNATPLSLIQGMFMMKAHQHGEKNPSPICARFRLNMSWPKSPPEEDFLVSAGPDCLIWTAALGSLEFIQ